MEHQHQQCDVQLAVLDGKFLERSLTKINMLLTPKIRAGRLEHLFRSVHGNDTLAKLAEAVRQSARSTSEVTNDHIWFEQCGKGSQVACRTEQLLSQPIPLAG